MFIQKDISSSTPIPFPPGAHMQDLLEFLFWIPVISLLVMIPIVCWLDWKYREVSHEWWVGVIIINIPFAAVMYILGIYEWWMLIISFVAMVIYFILMKLHYIEGADYMFISCIVMFFVYNPLSNHWLMALPFSIFLGTCVGISAFWLLAWNLLNKKGFTVEINGNFPMMFPISAALVLTVLLA